MRFASRSRIGSSVSLLGIVFLAGCNGKPASVGSAPVVLDSLRETIGACTYEVRVPRLVEATEASRRIDRSLHEVVAEWFRGTREQPPVAGASCPAAGSLRVDLHGHGIFQVSTEFPARPEQTYGSVERYSFFLHDGRPVSEDALFEPSRIETLRSAVQQKYETAYRATLRERALRQEPETEHDTSSGDGVFCPRNGNLPDLSTFAFTSEGLSFHDDSGFPMHARACSGTTVTFSWTEMDPYVRRDAARLIQRP